MAKHRRTPRPRTHQAEWARRTRLAVERGFRSVYEQSKHAAAITTHAAYSALPDTALTARTRAFRVISEARRSGEMMEVVAERLNVSVAAVRYWAAPALYPPTNRGTRVRPADRLLRVRHVIFVGGDGFEAVAIRGSRKSDLAYQVFQTQWDFLHGQATADDLAQFRHVQIGGRTVETDPNELERLGAAGFDVELASRLVVS